MKQPTKTIKKKSSRKGDEEDPIELTNRDGHAIINSMNTQANLELPRSTETTVSVDSFFHSVESNGRTEQLVEATLVPDHSTTHDEIDQGEECNGDQVGNCNNTPIIVEARPPKMMDAARDLVQTCHGRQLLLWMILGTALVVGGVTALAYKFTDSNPSNNAQSTPTASTNQGPSQGTASSDTMVPTLAPAAAGLYAPTPSFQPLLPNETLAPTTAPEGYVANLLPNYTLAALQDPYSPQSQAMEWLLTQPLPFQNNTDITDERILQRFALATLYFSTNGIGWRWKRYWLHDTSSIISECDWWYSSSGSVCNAQGQLTSLNLDENILRGTLPKEIALLTELTHISMVADVFFVSAETKADKTLTGTLPVEWMQSLTNLHSLDLSRNAITGTIPTEIGLWTSLRVLKLLENNLQGELPTELFGLRHLNELWLYDNRLEGTFPVQIGQVGTLEVLHAATNRFTGTIPSSVTRLSNLKQLQLQRNRFTGTIPREITQMHQLDDLWLSNNRLTGTVHTDFGRMVRLQGLWLGGNDLSGTIPSELGEMKDLKDIDLSKSDITGTIPTELGKWGSHVFRVILDDTSLVGAVPQALCRNTNSNPLFRVFVDCAKLSCSCRCCWCNCGSLLP